MGLPNIIIDFNSKASTAIKRGEKGVVAVIIRETDKLIKRITSESEIPDSLDKDNKEYIKRAFLGGIKPIKELLIIATNSIDDALSVLEAERFDYVVGPHDINSSEATSIANGIKDLRDNKNIKVKAVLPNTAADHEGIINFVTDNIYVGDKQYSTSQYCSRMAGLLAGTPLQVSCTYHVLNEVTDVPKFSKSELDSKIDRGELVVFHDGEKVKVGRGVNSLTSIGALKGDDYQSIKIIDTIDMIETDIRRTAEDSYIGKYPNNYDNKCTLIVSIQGYLEGLRNEGLLDENILVGIDMQEQIKFIKDKGIDIDDMNEQEIKEFNTKSSVFLKAQFKILNAIEDIKLNCFI